MSSLTDRASSEVLTITNIVSSPAIVPKIIGFAIASIAEAAACAVPLSVLTTKRFSALLTDTTLFPNMSISLTVLSVVPKCN